jgi:hypothetical protein
MFYRLSNAPFGNIYINNTPTILLQNVSETLSIPNITVTFPGGEYTVPSSGIYRISLRVYYNYVPNPATPNQIAFVHTYIWNNTLGTVMGQKFLTTIYPQSVSKEVSFDEVLPLSATNTYQLLAVTNVTPSPPPNPAPYGVMIQVLGQVPIPGSPSTTQPSASPFVFALDRLQ